MYHRYAYFKKLDYFSTECIYSPDAYRGHARVFLKDLEAARPSAIIDIIHSGEAFEIKEEIKAAQKLQRESLMLHSIIKLMLPQETCQRCGYMSSNALCKACTLLEGLERGMAESGIVCTFLSSTLSIVSSTLSRRIGRARNSMLKVLLLIIFALSLFSSHLLAILWFLSSLHRLYLEIERNPTAGKILGLHH